MEVSLVMFTQQGERREFPIVTKRATIGRNTECNVQIELPVVSRRHCELQMKGDVLFVRDLGSSNGTYVNEKRIQESGLHAGDTLTVGPVVFTVVIDGHPAKVSPLPSVVDPKKKEASRGRPRPQPVANDDTGSVDMDDSAAMNILEDEEEESHDPLAALEALSKSKKR
jgi:pSer/pThr/pTyr-binding forkhead associated (FHA) protein